MCEGLTPKKSSGGHQGAASEDKIGALASKQGEWAAVGYEKKLGYLEQIVENFTSLNFDDLVGTHGVTEAAMMGYPAETVEGKSEATSCAFLYVVITKTTLDRLVDLYKIHLGKMKKPVIQTTVSPITGQTIFHTCPVISADKYGQLAKCKGEVWLKADSAPEIFDMEHLREDGLKVILGAGNHTFLSAVDSLFSLFQEHRVVYLKHHPLRAHHDIILRKIMEPLISAGYFEMEIDNGSIQRAKEIVNHPQVAAVHLTGGKKTHDAIVWGNEQPRKEPILKAKMTSELGCITPWLVAPQDYSDKELEHQAKHIFSSLFNNAGANCNSPKVFVICDNWKQKEKFIDYLVKQCEHDMLPNAYYPGAEKRWKDYQKAYPEAIEIKSNKGLSAQDRKLESSIPKLVKPILLPWLRVDVNVDLDCEIGREKASKEYAFRNEPFAPVFTFAYVKDFGTAVQLCNDYIYGSLSCSMTAKEETDEVCKAIANLKYGGVCVNAWSAMCYAITGGTWGAFPGETLEAVESGIGQINNHFMIPNIQKTVMKSPIVDMVQAHREDDQVGFANKFRAVGMFVLKPGLFTFANLMTGVAFGKRLPPVSAMVPAFAILAVIVVAHCFSSSLNN